MTEMNNVRTKTAPRRLNATKKIALRGDESIKGFWSGPTIAIAELSTSIHPSWETISNSIDKEEPKLSKLYPSGFDQLRGARTFQFSRLVAYSPIHVAFLIPALVSLQEY